jgi:hypothetical protein
MITSVSGFMTISYCAITMQVAMVEIKFNLIYLSFALLFLLVKENQNK